MRMPDGVSRVPIIKDQGSLGLVMEARERHKPPIIIPEEDFPIALQERVAKIKKDDGINSERVFTLEDNVLCIDEIPHQQWINERMQKMRQVKESGSVGLDIEPKNFIRQKNGVWIIKKTK